MQGGSKSPQASLRACGVNPRRLEDGARGTPAGLKRQKFRCILLDSKMSDVISCDHSCGTTQTRASCRFVAPSHRAFLSAKEPPQDAPPPTPFAFNPHLPLAGP